MVHFVSAPTMKGKLYFNIDTPVGAGARGSARNDVLLVQFYFVLKHDVADPDEAIYKQIEQTGVCDDKLIEAIKVFQRTRPKQLIEDGLVSRAQGLHFNGIFWTIVGMNFGIHLFCRPVWPRIDMHPKCDRELGLSIRQAFGVPND